MSHAAGRMADVTPRHITSHHDMCTNAYAADRKQGKQGGSGVSMQTDRQTDRQTMNSLLVFGGMGNGRTDASMNEHMVLQQRVSPYNRQRLYVTQSPSWYPKLAGQSNPIHTHPHTHTHPGIQAGRHTQAQSHHHHHSSWRPTMPCLLLTNSMTLSSLSRPPLMVYTGCRACLPCLIGWLAVARRSPSSLSLLISLSPPLSVWIMCVDHVCVSAAAASVGL